MSGNAMRYIIGISFAALAIWILQATGILMAVAVFLMVGAIPGTSISISPTLMLVLLLLLALGITYWTVRQRPLRQIKALKQGYEKTTFVANLAPQAVAASAPHKEAFYVKGLKAGFHASHHRTYRMRQRLGRGIIYAAKTVTYFIVRLVRPLFVVSVVAAITTRVAARELAMWIKPHLKHAGAWLKVQASYSLKGTASAHTVRRMYKNLKTLLPKRTK